MNYIILSFLYEEMDSIFKTSNIQKKKCLRCGKCCSKEILRRQMGGIGIDYKGNYIKDPMISGTLFSFEKPLLEKNIKEIYRIKPKFLPALAFYLKAYKIGFVSMYQLPIKKNGYCYYYKELKGCTIYDSRPICCRIYPITTLESITTLANKCQGVRKLFAFLSDKQYLNLENPSFSSIKEIFYEEFIMSKIYNSLLEAHGSTFSILETIFHRLDRFNPRFRDYRLFDLEGLVKWSESVGKYRKLIGKYEIQLEKLELKIRKIFSNWRKKLKINEKR